MAEVLHLLKKDHQKVKNLLEDLEEASPYAIVKRRDLLMQLKEELQLHEKIEEKLFFPELKAAPATKPVIQEVSGAHKLADELLANLEATDFTHEAWLTRLTALKEKILRHVKEEEREIFPLIKKHLGQAKLQEMGDKMLHMKTLA